MRGFFAGHFKYMACNTPGGVDSISSFGEDGLADREGRWFFKVVDLKKGESTGIGSTGPPEQTRVLAAFEP